MPLSRCVTKEMDVNISEQVGYRLRFEDCTSNKTVMNYFTYGKLLREAMTDPLLMSYKMVVFDEAHEKTLLTDLLCALLKKLMIRSLELKLVIMYATLEAEKFHAYFGGSQILQISGKLYEVKIIYQKNPVQNSLRF